MRSRLIRTLAVLSGVLAMTLAPLPRASAGTVLTTTMFATAFTNTGALGDPCTASWKPCPPATSTSEKTDGLGLPVTNITTDGNTRGFGVSTTVCLDSGVNVLKSGKQPAQFGTCGFTMTGVVTGYCALATGSGTGWYYDTFAQWYSFSWKLTWTGPTSDLSTITVTGPITKSSNGRTGHFRATFVAQLTPTGACLTKQAHVWQLTGEMQVKIEN